MLEPEDIVRYEEDGPRVVLLDQRRLPDEEVELECRSVAEVVEAIRELAIRGAPAIGVAAAYGLRSQPRVARTSTTRPPRSRAARPTAVNLAWALEQMRDDPTPGSRTRAPRGRGRTLPRDGRTRRGALRRRHASAHALQRGRPGDRRLRQRGRRAADGLGARRARARLGRRDAPAAAGLAPDGVGARDRRHPARRDRRLRCGVADGRRRGRLRRHRSRSHRRERRHREQDRHVLARSARRAPRASRSTSSRRPRPSTSRLRPAPRFRSKSAPPRRSPTALRRPQPGFRRHAGRPDRRRSSPSTASTARRMRESLSALV